MKISLNWIKEYVEIDCSLEELCHKFTMAGLEVEKKEKYGSDDILEFEITPNRADCLSLLGMAREISAILDKEKNFPEIKDIADIVEKCDIEIQDKDSCNRYVGTIIKNITIDKTKRDMKTKLESLGLRSINNVVDITNFCMMEMGQPLHAFDYDKIEGGKIIVRRARKGEKIITIDDVERELDESVLVIADSKKPIAIAGIMGGKETEVTDSTKNILIESAYFNQVLIRRSSRKIGLSSDSSYRFERGVNYSTVRTCSNRAINLILSACGGTISAHKDEDLGLGIAENQNIKIAVKNINKFLGSNLSSSVIENILKKLDFAVLVSDDQLTVKAPDFRKDIKQDVDVIEEIARIVGYDNMPTSLPFIKSSTVLPNKKIRTKNKILNSMLAQGYDQIITYAMVNEDSLKKAKLDDLEILRVKNPLSNDQAIMRPHLMPSMLQVVGTNLNRGQKNLKLFEIGKSYVGSIEKELLGAVVTGTEDFDWRKQKQEKLDFYSLKGVIEVAIKASGAEVETINTSRINVSILEEGQSAKIEVDGSQIGIIGKVDEDVLNNFDIKHAVVYFAQIDLECVYSKEERHVKFSALCEFPSITRDISIAVSQEKEVVSFENIIKEFDGLDTVEVTSSFLEEYRGEKIEKGKKGWVFSINYQSRTQTLTDAQVTEIHSKICEKALKELGAAIR